MNTEEQKNDKDFTRRSFASVSAMHTTQTALIALVAALFLLTLACAPREEPLSAELQGALDSIRPERIEDQMRTLASDDFEGRGTATTGFKRAAEHVGRQFGEIGLDPLDDETYFQSVPLRSSHVIQDDSSVRLVRPRPAATLESDVDYVLYADVLRESAQVTADVVYVGYGIQAPEQGHDDYRGADVKDKLVALFRGAPSNLPPNERAYYASTWFKLKTAAEHGAVGVIWLSTPEQLQRAPWSRVVRELRHGSMRWVEETGIPHGVHPGLFAALRMSESGMEKLFRGVDGGLEGVVAALDDPDTRGAAAVQLPARVQIHAKYRHQTLESPNVVGIIRGADPSRAKECLVLTAHLDHLGIGIPEEGDSIYNGAYDNASGVAVLLEVARTLRRSTLRPARSIVFLAVTGEERGLLGSDFFVRNPPVGTPRIVANLNLDMVLMHRQLDEVIAFGIEHSTLRGPIELAAQMLGVRLVPDPLPHEAIFVRSDQFSFVRQGIPAAFLAPGISASPGQGQEHFQAWMREIYHSPRDDMEQAFDFEAGAKFARLNLLVAHLIADSEAPPNWNPGDFFQKRFAP